MIDKGKILQTLIENVGREISSLEHASHQTRSDACGDQMKSDGKYDTQAIEAGYLVGAQKKRVEELKLELQMLEAIELRPFSKKEEIAIGALVEIMLNGYSRKYFISPTAGGTLLSIEDEPVLVISVFSPIGSEVLGLQEGNVFEIETSSGERTYIIKKVS